MPRARQPDRAQYRGGGPHEPNGRPACPPSGCGWSDGAKLEQQAEVVSSRPMVCDLAIADTKDMHVIYRINLADPRRRNQLRTLDANPAWRHRHRGSGRRASKLSAHHHAADNLVALGDHAVDLVPAIGKGCVEHPVDHIDGVATPCRFLSFTT